MAQNERRALEDEKANVDDEEDAGPLSGGNVYRAKRESAREEQTTAKQGGKREKEGELPNSPDLSLDLALDPDMTRRESEFNLSRENSGDEQSRRTQVPGSHTCTMARLGLGREYYETPVISP